MSDASDSVFSQQPGEKGSGTSSSPSTVPSSSSPSQNAGDLAESKTDECKREGSVECESLRKTPSLEGVSAGGCKVLTEDGLKELLYTSCSSDSPEFESIINLYLDQVKSHSEEISMYCETCDSIPLETIFEHSGLYSKLDLKNFVRLGPSAIGYPSASWKNVTEKDRGVEAPAEVGKVEAIDTEQTRMKLKLRITRETHPTPEDLRNDIVLKMIVVEEVNKKDLMGPLRAYLSPEGEVEFHTGCPGQKEGVEDYLLYLSKSVNTVGTPDELGFEIVINAITGYPFGTNIDGSSSKSASRDEEKQCIENEASENGLVDDSLTSKVADDVPESRSMISEVIPSTGSLLHGDSADFVTETDNPEGTLDDAVLSSELSLNVLDKVIDEVLGKATLSDALTTAVKRPLWHQGVDLSEIFSETDSDSDLSDNENVKDLELPTAADLKILELLRSSSSVDSDASGMSAYSEDDIEAGLCRLTLEKGAEDGDDEGGSVDDYDDEDGTEEDIHVSSAVASTKELSAVSDEARYEAIRPMESPCSKLDMPMSLKDIGLQVIDPMGLNIIRLLRNKPDKGVSPKKENAPKGCVQGSGGSQEGSKTKVVASTKPSALPAKPTKEKSTLKENNHNAKTGIAKNDGNSSSTLKSLENIADALLPVVSEDEDGVNTVPKGQECSQENLPEKTIPPILGQMPEPAPLGFSRHLASSVSGPAHPIFGTAHPALGSTHPALGSTHPAHGSTHPALGSTHSALGSTHPALGVPLIKTHQWFPMLVEVPNRKVGPAGPNHNFPPQAPPNSQFQLDIFSKWPDEFGRHVANALFSMSIEQRVRVIEHFSDVLNQCISGNLDRFAPQNGSNPAQRVQFNPVRPSTRPPFSQNPYGAANTNMASSSQNAQSNFGPPQNWPPAAFPQMQLSQSQIGSALQNNQVTKNHFSSPSNIFEGALKNSESADDKNPSPTTTPLSQISSSKSTRASDSSVEKSKTKTSPSHSESGKRAKSYWEGLKSLRAAKKAAKKAQTDSKFSGTVKNKGFSVYPSSRKPAGSKAKPTTNVIKKATQSDQNMPNASNSQNSNGSSSSSAHPTNKSGQTKQNQASNHPAKKPATQNPPKTQSNQTQGSTKPKSPSNQLSQPNTGSNLPAQSSRETNVNVDSETNANSNSSKKTKRSKKKQLGEPKK